MNALAKSTKPNPGTVRWLRLALALGSLAAFGLAYLLSEGIRSEVDRGPRRSARTAKEKREEKGR
jgi:hypothetical protein